MLTIEKRDFIHSQLHNASEEFINDTYDKLISNIDNENPIVGYKANGDEIRRLDFLEDLRVSEEQYKNGQYTTLEDLIKESESWV